LVAESEKVSGDLVVVVFRLFVRVYAPFAENFPRLRVRRLVCEDMEGAVDFGERFREPEPRNIPRDGAERRERIVVAEP